MPDMQRHKACVRACPLDMHLLLSDHKLRKTPRLLGADTKPAGNEAIYGTTVDFRFSSAAKMPTPAKAAMLPPVHFALISQDGRHYKFHLKQLSEVSNEAHEESTPRASNSSQVPFFGRPLP